VVNIDGGSRRAGVPRDLSKRLVARPRASRNPVSWSSMTQNRASRRWSTPRQIALQRALALPEPAYAHLPLVVGREGSKLGKRDGALPLPTLDSTRIRTTLSAALRILGIDAESLDIALPHFDPKRIARSAKITSV
jgi:hypothetical protein